MRTRAESVLLEFPSPDFRLIIRSSVCLSVQILAETRKILLPR